MIPKTVSAKEQVLLVQGDLLRNICQFLNYRGVHSVARMSHRTLCSIQKTKEMNHFFNFTVLASTPDLGNTPECEFIVRAPPNVLKFILDNTGSDAFIALSDNMECQGIITKSDWHHIFRRNLVQLLEESDIQDLGSTARMFLRSIFRNDAHKCLLTILEVWPAHINITGMRGGERTRTHTQKKREYMHTRRAQVKRCTHTHSQVI